MEDKKPEGIKKPIHKSRTNRSIAAVVALLLVNQARRYLGFELTPEMEAMVNDQILPALVTFLGGLAIMFRQKATLLVPELAEAIEKAAPPAPALEPAAVPVPDPPPESVPAEPAPEPAKKPTLPPKPDPEPEIEDPDEKKLPEPKKPRKRRTRRKPKTTK